MTDVSRSPGVDRRLPARSRARGVPKRVRQEHTAPRWLRSPAGVSWRLLVVLAMVALIFFARRIQLLFIAVFLAFVFTAVLRPTVDFLGALGCRGDSPPRWRSSGGSSSSSGCSRTCALDRQPVGRLTKQFQRRAVGRIGDFLTDGSLPFDITNEQIRRVDQHRSEVVGRAAWRARRRPGRVRWSRCSRPWRWPGVHGSPGPRTRDVDLRSQPATTRLRESWMTAGGGGWGAAR